MNQPHACHDHSHGEGSDDLTDGFRLFGTRLALAAPVLFILSHADGVARA
jgi:hypothetical protein